MKDQHHVCTCGYEARSVRDLDDHIVYMTSSQLVNDPAIHAEAGANR